MKEIETNRDRAEVRNAGKRFANLYNAENTLRVDSGTLSSESHSKDESETVLLGLEIFLQGKAQIKVADEAVQIVGIHTEKFRGFRNVATCLLESIQDELLFQIDDGGVIVGG